MKYLIMQISIVFLSMISFSNAQMSENPTFSADGNTTYYQKCRAITYPPHAYACIEAGYSKLQEDLVTKEYRKVSGLGCSKKVAHTDADTVALVKSLCSKINGNSVSVHNNRGKFKPGFNVSRVCETFGCSSGSSTENTSKKRNRGNNSNNAE